jgi:hypothetical protein
MQNGSFVLPSYPALLDSRLTAMLLSPALGLCPIELFEGYRSLIGISMFHPNNPGMSHHTVPEANLLLR